MLIRRRHQQSRLLERYWTRLLQGRRAQMLVTPPGELDPEVVDSAVQLAVVAQRLRPSPAFVAELRERLNVAAVSVANPATRDRSWNRSALIPRSGTNVQPPIGRAPSAAAGDEQLVVSRARDEPRPVSLAERRWPRESLKLVAAVIAFVTVGIILTLALRDNGTDEQPAIDVPLPTTTATATAVETPTTTPSATAVSTATVAAVAPTHTVAVPTARKTTIPVGAGPFGIVAGAGSIWVPNLGDGTLMRVDPATNSVVATIDLDASPVDPLNMPSAPIAVAASDSAVWVTRYVSGSTPDSMVRELLRIDPATNEIVATIPLDVTPSFSALGFGSLWITSREDNVVVRIDTTTNAVITTIAVDAPLAIVIDERSVWVSRGSTANTSIGNVEHTMIEIDPLTNSVIGTFPVDQFTIWFASGEGSLWIPDDATRALLRIDPLTYEVVARIALTIPGVPVVSSGSVWVQSGTLRTLTQIDITTNTIVATFPSADVGGPIVAFDGAIWIAEAVFAQLIRIDPSDP